MSTDYMSVDKTQHRPLSDCCCYKPDFVSMAEGTSCLPVGIVVVYCRVAKRGRGKRTRLVLFCF
jgi:hypothetical protein